MTAQPALDRAQTLAASPAAIAAMIQIGVDAAPLEACGALIGVCTYGESWEVRAALGVPNTADNPQQNYLIPADTVRAIERAAEGTGLQVVGFFHSHPRSGAAPSPTDLESAWPGYIYAIVDAVNRIVRFWSLNPAGSFVEVARP